MKVITIEADAFELITHKIQLLTESINLLYGENSIKKLNGWLDNQDVCLLIGVSKRTLYYYRISGKLPFTQIGKKIYYKEKDVEHLFKSL